MREQDTISRKRMAQILKEEIAAFQLEEQFLREHEAAIKERKDIQSMIAEEFIKRHYGKNIDVHQIDEGVWEKVKGGLAKMGQISNLVPGQKAKKAKSAEDLAAALEDAGNALFLPALKAFKERGFPNQESGESFRKNVDSLVQMYGAVIASVEAGNTPYETGKKTIELLQQYVTDAATQLKSVYGVTNEELETEELAEAEEAELDALEEAFREEETALTEELVQEINLNRIDRLVDAGRISPMDGVKRIEKAMRGPAGKGLKKIFRNRTKRAMRDQIIRKAVETSGEEAVKKVAPKIVKTIPKTVMKKFATKSMGIVTTSPKTAGPIVNTITKAPTVGGFLASLGVTPALAAGAAAAAAAGFLFYKNRKSSRAASLRDLGKKLVVPPDLEASAIDSEDLMTKDPEEIEQQQSSLEAEKDEERGPEGEVDPGGDPGDPGPPGDPITEPGEPEAAGRGDIYVFRGKAGKGLQSQLAKAGIKGPDMSGLLKGLRADLTDAGFNVLEEAKREVIALTNTLAALEQMADPAQKEAAKKILVQMLRANRVKLNPQDSRALAPAAAGAEAAPGGEAAAGAEAAPGGETPAAGTEQAATGKECPEGQYMGKSGKCVDDRLPQAYSEQQIQETLDRWHKLAGIIKG